ncbi:MAG: hypothetical protein ABIZ05_07020 [Pseudonocardiaceae bacterium]
MIGLQFYPLTDACPVGGGRIGRERTTKKITVTLPIEDVEALQRLAESGQVESFSRYVTDAVAFRRAREDGLAVLERRFGKPPEYALQWARDLIARRLGPHNPTA